MNATLPNGPQTVEDHGLGGNCQRCKRVGWDAAILADTEEWRAPLCIDCHDEVDGDPDWDMKPGAKS